MFASVDEVIASDHEPVFCLLSLPRENGGFGASFTGLEKRKYTPVLYVTILNWVHRLHRVTWAHYRVITAKAYS